MYGDRHSKCSFWIEVKTASLNTGVATLHELENITS